MARRLPIFRRSIADDWRSLLGWTVGIVGVIALYLPLFPSIGGNGQMQQIIESMPPELVNTLGFEAIGSGAGYTQGTFFGLIGFLLLVIAATSWGVGRDRRRRGVRPSRARARPRRRARPVRSSSPRSRS